MTAPFWIILAIALVCILVVPLIQHQDNVRAWELATQFLSCARCGKVDARHEGHEGLDRKWYCSRAHLPEFMAVRGGTTPPPESTPT